MAPDPDELPVGLPRNFLRQSLLLLIGEGPAHGYDVLLRLQDLGFPRRDPGGLYRSLRLLEQEGLIESEWGESQIGPPRRIYWLTAEGFDWLHAYAGVLRQTHERIGDFLARYQKLAEAPSGSRAQSEES